MYSSFRWQWICISQRSALHPSHSSLSMRALLFYSLVENISMTSSFTKKEICAHKTNYIYISMLALSMLPVSVIILFDVRIVPTPTMSYFLFFISLYIFCYFLIFFATSWWWYMYVYISGFISRFRFVLILLLL